MSIFRLFTISVVVFLIDYCHGGGGGGGGGGSGLIDDCILCVPTIRCDETLQGDYANLESNVVLYRRMRIGDELILRGTIPEDAKEILIEIYRDVFVGSLSKGNQVQPPLLQMKHSYETNMTFIRSGLAKDEWGAFRETTLPPSIQGKKPWTLLIRINSNYDGVEAGDSTGYYGNNIKWEGAATTQSFSISGDWKTTSVSLNCDPAKKPILI